MNNNIYFDVNPSGAINVMDDVNVVSFLFHGENHGKQLQIVKSQHNQIPRFAIISRDFHHEKVNSPHLRHPPYLWHHWKPLITIDAHLINSMLRKFLVLFTDKI